MMPYTEDDAREDIREHIQRVEDVVRATGLTGYEHALETARELLVAKLMRVYHQGAVDALDAAILRSGGKKE